MLEKSCRRQACRRFYTDTRPVGAVCSQMALVCSFSFVTMSVAVLRLMSTPSIYTRSAAILVKDDSKSGSSGGAMSEFPIWVYSDQIPISITSCSR